MMKPVPGRYGRLPQTSLGFWLVAALGGVASCSGVTPQGAVDVGPAAIIPPPAAPPHTVPPPISGGTLLVSRDSTTVAAADPDRDSVWIVDAGKQTLRSVVRLDEGSQPGRLVEDQDGMLHVILRRGGQVVKIDPQSGAVVSSRSVCAAPRGLAYDAATDNLHIACASGQLLTMKARGGGAVRTLRLDPDLRDVAVIGDHLLVTRFRNAELLDLDSSGAVVARMKPRQSSGMAGPGATATPTTAWRLAALPEGQAVMLHQRALDGPLPVVPSYYGSGGPVTGNNCPSSGVVSPGLTVFNGASTKLGPGAILEALPLLVDVAVSRDGQTVALVNASPRPSRLPVASPVMTVSLGDLGPTDPCVAPAVPSNSFSVDVQPVAAAFDGQGLLWVQVRNPAELHVLHARPPHDRIALAGATDRSDEGHRLFHTATATFIACASCHAEAGDDGHTWGFEVGLRRTPSLRGGLLATAPFHWGGELGDLTAVMTEVFTGRMAGPVLSPVQVDMVGRWLDSQAALPKDPPLDAQQVERGRTLFLDPVVGCVACHSGLHFTDNANHLVNTGAEFQVPSLVDVALRAPYLHNGCAKSLRDRFDPACGGGDFHGKTSQLTASQLDDLIAYLETL